MRCRSTMIIAQLELGPPVQDQTESYIPYSLREVRRFFNIPALLTSTEKMRETGPKVYLPYPRRLEHLTNHRCHSKDSISSSVNLRPWVLVRSRASTFNLPHGIPVLRFRIALPDFDFRMYLRPKESNNRKIWLDQTQIVQCKLNVKYKYKKIILTKFEIKEAEEVRNPLKWGKPVNRINNSA